MQLAVFDLDGTITRHDTLAPYVLGYLRRRPWRLPRLLAVLPALLQFAFDRDRGALKAAVIAWTLGGLTRTEIEAWTAEFVPALLRGGVFEHALLRIREHQRANDRLVLLSASTDLYVPAIGRTLGFAETICTGVRWQDEKLDGRLATPNRRGEEKRRCLEALRRKHPGVKTVAYGNAGSDLPHLAVAERGVLVNGSGHARQEAEKLGIECVSWW